MEASRLSTVEDERSHVFINPIKRINEGHDVPQFLRSRAYHDIMTFVLQLNRAMYPCRVHGSNNQSNTVQSWELDSPNVSFSAAVCRIQSMLTALNNIVDEVPPDPGPRRFGNVSFRRWNELVEARASSLLRQGLSEQLLDLGIGTESDAQTELQSYFLGAFGSAQRLDYGSGHELSFLAFLGCIWKLRGFSMSPVGEEERGIVLGIIEP